jgi:DNA-binding CsgD family transcriptional regulator
MMTFAMRKVELARVAAEAAEVCDLRELGDRVLPHLARAANASGALLYRYNDDGRLEPIGGSISELIETYARHYLHQDPVQVHPRTLAPQPRVVLATRALDRLTYRRSAAYGEFYQPYDLDHLACMWLTHLPYAAPGMTGLMIARDDGSGDYDRDDQRALASLLPALSAAAARALRLRDLDRRRDALEALAASGGARLVLSRSGSVLWASRAATELMPQVPEWLRTAARRVADAPRATTVAFGVHTAHLSIVRAASGEPLVLAELVGAAAVSHIDTLMQRLGLTRAEASVLWELSAGHSNAAIATQLAVSVETVRTHVRHILGKLGVKTRTQAALIASRHVPARG